MKTTTLLLLAIVSIPVSTAVFAEETKTTTTTTALAEKKNEVGISSRDGITMSGKDVLVTRNGVTETLTREMELANGVRVMVDGTVVARDGGKLTLGPSQLLNFDGQIVKLPVEAPVTTVIVKTPATDEASQKAAAAQKAAEDAAKAESARRGKESTDKHIKAGEGVQK